VSRNNLVELRAAKCDQMFRDRLEDVEFLIRMGEHPENIVKRLGLRSLHSAHSYFHKRGRLDVAQHFTKSVAEGVAA